MPSETRGKKKMKEKGRGSYSGGKRKDPRALATAGVVKRPKHTVRLSIAIVDSPAIQYALRTGETTSASDAIRAAQRCSRDKCAPTSDNRIAFRPLRLSDEATRHLDAVPVRSKFSNKSSEEKARFVAGMCRVHLRFLHLVPAHCQLYLVSIRDGGVGDDNDDDGELWDYYLVKWDSKDNDWHKRPYHLGECSADTIAIDPEARKYTAISSHANRRSSSSVSSDTSHGSMNSSSGGTANRPSQASARKSRERSLNVLLMDPLCITGSGSEAFLTRPFNLFAEYNDESEALPLELKDAIQSSQLLPRTPRLHMRHPRYGDLLNYRRADWHNTKVINRGGFGVIMTVPWRTSDLFEEYDDLPSYTEVVVKLSRANKRNDEGEYEEVAHSRRLKHCFCEAAHALMIGDAAATAVDSDADAKARMGINSFATYYGWFVYGDGEIAVVMERLDTDLIKALGYRSRDKKLGVKGALKRARRRCAIKKGQAISIIYAVTCAISEMHEGRRMADNFVHRDIKPHNIMLSVDGEPRIIDFSMCIQVGSKAHISSTRTYSPEHFEVSHEEGGGLGPDGQHRYKSGACDWYALAITIVNDIDPVCTIPDSIFEAAKAMGLSISDHGEDFDQSLLTHFLHVVSRKYADRFGSPDDDDDDDGYGEPGSDDDNDEADGSQQRDHDDDDDGRYEDDETYEDAQSGGTDNGNGLLEEEEGEDEEHKMVNFNRGDNDHLLATHAAPSFSSFSHLRHDPTNGRQSWLSRPPASYR